MKRFAFLFLGVLCSAMALYAEEQQPDRTWWDDDLGISGYYYFIEPDVCYSTRLCMEYRTGFYRLIVQKFGLEYDLFIENEESNDASISDTVYDGPEIVHPDGSSKQYVMLPDEIEVDGKIYKVTALENAPACGAEIVEIPSSIKYIKSNSYSAPKDRDGYHQCPNELIFNEGLETIMDNVFFRADITSLKLPGSLRSIGSDFAGKCRNLESVEFNEGLITIGENALSECPKLTEINLPSTLLTLGRNSFNSCENLEKLHISRWIRNRNGFEGIANECPNIKEIVYDSNTPYPAVNSFNKVNKEECTLYVPYRRGYVYAQTEGWKEFKNIVEMDELPTALHPADVAQIATPTPDDDAYTTLDGVRYQEWNDIPSNTIIVHNGCKVLKR